MTLWPVQLQHHRPPSSTKFADDTVVVARPPVTMRRPTLDDIANLSLWCQDNSLMLSLSKTKELIVAFRMTSEYLGFFTRHRGFMGLLWGG